VHRHVDRLYAERARSATRQQTASAIDLLDRLGELRSGARQLFVRVCDRQ
jgi:hypothetical protein